MKRIHCLAGLFGGILGAGVLALALAAHGGRFSAVLDIFTHFAPLYLAGGLLALVLTTASPLGGLRVLSVLLSMGGTLAAGGLIVPEYIRSLEVPTVELEASAETLKLVQFNAFGRNSRPDAAIRWVLAQDADVVILQEAAALRDRLIRDGPYIGTCLHCGAVILTRNNPIASHVTPWHNRDGAYVTTATISDLYGEFTIIGIHRAWPPRFKASRRQAAETAVLVSRHPRDRMILAGDFNSTPWSFTRRQEDRELGLIRRTRALATWPAEKISHNRFPAPFPYMPIDHVYAGPGWATVRVERGPKLGSDHYPVVVTLAAVKSVAR